jgi:hypothetical protein
LIISANNFVIALMRQRPWKTDRIAQRAFHSPWPQETQEVGNTPRSNRFWRRSKICRARGESCEAYGRERF